MEKNEKCSNKNLKIDTNVKHIESDKKSPSILTNLVKCSKCKCYFQLTGKKCPFCSSEKVKYISFDKKQKKPKKTKKEKKPKKQKRLKEYPLPISTSINENEKSNMINAFNMVQEIGKMNESGVSYVKINNNFNNIDGIICAQPEENSNSVTYTLPCLDEKDIQKFCHF